MAQLLQRMTRMSLATVMLLLLAFVAAEAQDVVAPFTVSAPSSVQLSVGKSVILTSPVDIKQLSIGTPGVVKHLLLSRRQLYLTGEQLGSTNLTIWDQSDQVAAIYDVIVSRDVTPLKMMLHRILPEETGIMVHSTNDSISLAGTVSSPENLKTALSVAEAYAPGSVINLMQVGGVHQVMLEVRVAEMSRSVLKRMGVNLAYIFQGQLLNGEVFYTFLNGLTGFNEDGDFVLSDNVNNAFTFRQGGADWSFFIDALKKNGLAKILAEPTLIALSGQRANFLAGGEIPVPVPDDDGIAIEYKEFGIGLDFMPTVLGDKINLVVEPQVSELDFNNAIELVGARIPAFTTRRASTTIELKEGQTFAIAGLIKDNLREAVSKFPLIGDVPVLGTLFRSSEFQKDQTELVIMVTPHLVKPIQADKAKLPTDGFIEPNDVEFYLLGMTEGRKREPEQTTGETLPATPAALSGPSGFDGELGHALPEEEKMQ